MLLTNWMVERIIIFMLDIFNLMDILSFLCLLIAIIIVWICILRLNNSTNRISKAVICSVLILIIISMILFAVSFVGYIANDMNTIL